MRGWSPLPLCALLACSSGETPQPPGAQQPAPVLKTDKGVDAAAKVIRIGTLNDESGPAATIGRPYAIGKRLLAARINAGGSDLLPDGWTIQLVERDHAYDPAAAAAAYDELRDEVLFVGTSFGTPHTLSLRPRLEADSMIAFPASLSSTMAEHPHTPTLGAAYAIEARRGMDLAIEEAGSPGGVKAAIVYQQDDYGQDGLSGWQAAARVHGVELVSEQAIDAGQQEVAPVIAALQAAGATHVLLAVLPSSSGPILSTAAQQGYGPVWIGTTPAWDDSFFDPQHVAPAALARYHQLNSLPYWGEALPGMDDFVAAYEAHGKPHAPNHYMLISYIQGLAQIEAADRAIARGDLTRAGYQAALSSIKAFDAGGLIRPINLSTTPYVVSDEIRVLAPELETRSWTEVMPYGSPRNKIKMRPGQDAPDEANAMYPPGEGPGGEPGEHP